MPDVPTPPAAHRRASIPCVPIVTSVGRSALEITSASNQTRDGSGDPTHVSSSQAQARWTNEISACSVEATNSAKATESDEAEEYATASETPHGDIGALAHRCGPEESKATVEDFEAGLERFRLKLRRVSDEVDRIKAARERAVSRAGKRPSGSQK
ncbi:hypothetical protein CONPUDRAFT_155522 [Coniophora puteana RWD-64-598 SS2]|uniref:Uncharacterized protein n=1 Tax=Coniophora puteana (strain RWD-64-598) TaxID=741705 RepID=A0A5M3MJJ1_CONPW|nr:uncharacterized protein CONPUDRAFT_155522 [Coniophora puteana RWD-64-598 SS2]EIW78795.1 hypothetical protein CONPUDRAFT_155522 [Coniophora puteana RWD-64-598 SS2]